MSPLERAAEAARNELGDYPHRDMWMSEGGLRNASHYEDVARAVIAAIRQPSEVMLDAAEDLEALSSRGTAGNMWTAMIDAILKKK